MADEFTNPTQFYPERGPRTLRPVWQLASYCPVTGVVLSLFAFMLIHDRIELGEPLAMLMVAAVFGFIAGLVCATPVYLALRNRSLDDALPWITWIVAATIFALTFLPFETTFLGLVVFLSAPACLLLTALLLAAQSPKRYYGNGICHHCGYDLRASFELGRCPECGWNFSSDAAGQSQANTTPRSLVRKTGKWIWRHPHAMLFAFVLIAGPSIVGDRIQQFRLERAILNAVEDCRKRKAPLRLADVTPFEWDQAHIIGGYASINSVEEQLGFRWVGVGRTGISSRDDIQILAFVKNREVVRSAVLRVGGKSGIEFINNSPFTHDVAFKVLPPDHNAMARLQIMRPDTMLTNSADD